MLERRRTPPPPDPPASAFLPGQPVIDSPRASAGTLAATWIGHATVLLQIGTVNVLTDPMWSDRASPVTFAGPHRIVPPGVPFEALPSLDLVLISHNHYDHLDRRTVNRIVDRFPDVVWAVPSGLGSWLARRGARNVLERQWWEEGAIGDVRIHCTPARHFSARTPWDRNRTLWCSWLVQAPSGSVFFAGDTAYHPEFATIAERHAPFDLVLVPIGAYEPRWFMRAVHMNPEDALQAYRDIASAHERMSHVAPPLLAIHWGTFKLTDEPLDEPPRRMAMAWRAAGLPPDQLWLLAHGETRTVVNRLRKDFRSA
jgi:N-acyl-phosphatidylethanolamine-hydrolysing phospholipase D